MGNRRKIRVSFQKNRETRSRGGDIRRQFLDGDPEQDEARGVERIRAKGDLSRKRTVVVDDDGQLSIDLSQAIRGRVITPHGLYCSVGTPDGQIHRCYTRRLLKTIQRDERSAIASGDWVWFRPAPDGEGLILRVEPRTHVLTRAYRRREQVIAANVDQVLIVGALIEPELKRNLIDRYLVSAGLGALDAVICLNKADLVDAYRIQPIIGLYSQLGYRVVMTSARTGLGMDGLRDLLAGRETVIVGPSGVGKSSLLNALEPSFHLTVRDVSESSKKGRHTTTSAQLLGMPGGGSVIDTPGIRQFDLWQVESGDVEIYFPEFRAFTPHCRFRGCLHLDEEECAIRSAVADRMISYSRYDSYSRICSPDAAGGGDEQ